MLVINSTILKIDHLLILLIAFVEWLRDFFFVNMAAYFYVTQLAGRVIKGLEDLERNRELKHS